MVTLYEQDFALWSEKMADLIVRKCFDELDITNLVEEIRDLSKRERDRLFSSMRLILHHLLKWDYQPELRSRRWLLTIQRERSNIEDYLAGSPSLKKYMTDEYLYKTYQKARLDAIAETGLEMPISCSYTLNDIISRSLTLT
ncbi:hypothetical protein B7O87_03100 [Cylindrospermopsis raciborskii CENA303]|uniref:DUF29 domain-containing protein n=1 Tax=Cylindrospermopsis raciborskii CENA303 TaxID=1170769 RepID=A0A1X4GBK3_9CYAN|nr:DUF29 domain-containing protein [Cylindrospermopsis raciborskii]OSO94410.1 hypothetical protein B7O87_03100 [Cylindrospermopsis raciborskii CENA303]